jgi:short-subunit dehydrogenase
LPTHRDSRVALITGASSGIGWATAELAAERGLAVVLTARRLDRLESLARQITMNGGRAVTVAGDIIAADVRQRAVNTAISAFGRLDILVNNAGLGKAGAIDAMDEATARYIFEVNFFALYELTRVALPHIERQRGTIINVASLAARIAVPPLSVYSASKFAVAGFTEALRRELRSRHIAVCLVNPGPVRTEFGQVAGYERVNAGFGTRPEAVARRIVRLFDHPRSAVAVPGWMGAATHLLELAPGLVDWGYQLTARVRPDLVGTAPQPSS